VYIPDYFKSPDLKASLQLMRDNPFAYFMSAVDDRVLFSPLPTIVEESHGRISIYAHMAAVNDHSRHLDNRHISVVFMGTHHYISPRWYIDPRSVPTWNYALVFARGISSVLDFPDTMNLLKKLSERFDPEWTALEKEKESYYLKMVSQIVAFRIECESVEGKFKLSQNHPLEDRKRVVEALSTADEEGKVMAELMKGTVLNESRKT